MIFRKAGLFSHSIAVTTPMISRRLIVPNCRLSVLSSEFVPDSTNLPEESVAAGMHRVSLQACTP